MNLTQITAEEYLISQKKKILFSQLKSIGKQLSLTKDLSIGKKIKKCWAIVKPKKTLSELAIKAKLLSKWFSK